MLKRMAIMITYVVYGTTTDNEKEILPGWSDVALSETGIQQSKNLISLIDIHLFDTVFYSDLKRAVDSALLTYALNPYSCSKQIRSTRQPVPPLTP